jgi:hypothetical protein
MQISFLKQLLSLGLAAVMTLGVMAGIDHQAQVPSTDPLLAHVVAPRA